MSDRTFDPRALDVEHFIRESGQWTQQGALPDMPRLAECAAPERPALPTDVLVWGVRGELRQESGASEHWLHLEADTALHLSCQRCLKPLEHRLSVRASVRFVRGEAEAERQDNESEEDVLAFSRHFDVQTLVEDELLLQLPLVPRHEACPSPLNVENPSKPGEEPAAAPHPFAALAQWKRGA